MFTNYISPSKYDSLTKQGWDFYPIDKGYKIQIEKYLSELPENDFVAKGCYMTSSIRGHHDRYVMSRER